MTISFGDDLRAVIHLDHAGLSGMQNVLHYEAGAGVSDSEANVVAAITSQVLTILANVATLTANNVLGVEVVCSKRNTGTGKWEAFGIGDISGWSGSSAAEYLPHGAAGLIRYFTSGVGNQARHFVGGFTEDSNNDGVVTGPLLTALGNYAADVVANIAVAGGNLGATWWSDVDVVARDRDSGYVVNTVWSYQRRRRPGVGS